MALTGAQLNQITMFQLFFTGMGGIITGYLSDRFGRKTILQWTIILYCIGTFLSGYATGFHSLLWSRIITALGVGGEWAIGHTLVAESVPAGKRGVFGAILQTGAPFGVGLANLMGSFFVPIEGWRRTFMVSAIPAVMLIFIRRFMPESPLWLAKKTEKSSSIITLLKRPYLKLTTLCFILTTVNGASYWLTYTWFPEYLHKHRNIEVSIAGWWIFAVVGGEIIGYGIFGFLADKVGRRPTFTGFALIMTIGLFAISIFWTELYGVPFLIQAFMFLVGVGTGTWSCFGPFFAELFPTHLRNTASGTIFNLSRSAQFFSLWTLSLIPQNQQLVGGLVMAGICAALASIFIWTLPETKGRKLE